MIKIKVNPDSPVSQFPDWPEYPYFNNYIIKVNPTGPE
jgi:hypothetical protein